MPTPRASFVDQQARYVADACEPLVKASQHGKLRFDAVARGAYPGRRLGKAIVPGVCTLGYWDAGSAQEWGLDWHRNEGIEVTFLERGELPFSVDRKELLLKAGDVTITRPWQQHRVGDPWIRQSRLHWLILDVGVRRPNHTWKWPSWVVLAPEVLRRLTELLSHNETPVWPASRDFAQCWQKIGKALVATQNGISESRLKVAINEMLLCLLELIEAEAPKLDSSLVSSQRTVELFLTEIKGDEQRRNFPWKVVSMAEHCGLGVTHFNALCEKAANCSPARYLLQCRIEAAKRMLTDSPQLSVTEVAHRNGFGSSQYFATAFRTETGCSPKEFRLKR